MSSLPSDSKARKDVPLFRGCLMYFPDALAAVAALSKAGNDKHNPGQPLHWSREKSSDHADCIMRHLIDAGQHHHNVDPDDGVLHVVKVAWRALALAQLALESQASRYARNDQYELCPACGRSKAWHVNGKCPEIKTTKKEPDGTDPVAAAYAEDILGAR